MFRTNTARKEAQELEVRRSYVARVSHTDRNHRMVTATEIAAFDYCPESWRLRHMLRLAPTSTGRFEVGKEYELQLRAADAQAIESEHKQFVRRFKRRAKMGVAVLVVWCTIWIMYGCSY